MNMKFFEWAHLPTNLQPISRNVGVLAHEMNTTLPEGPEKEAGLRKLLEAKDCFVRAMLLVALIVLAGCTVQQKRGWSTQEKLVWYDDTTSGVRCYQVVPWDGVSCLRK